MNDIGDQIERGSDGPEFSNVQPVPPTVIEENKELRIWCNWASKEIIIGDELNKKLHQQLINASTEQSRLHGIIQNIKANNNTLRRRRKEKHEKLSAALAELTTVKQCADDAVADANTCRKLADRQTRLLEEAQAVMDKLPKHADTGKPFVPGRDAAWAIDEGEIIPVEMRWREQWEWPVPGGFQVGQPYSTAAAALAAKEKT